MKRLVSKFALIAYCLMLFGGPAVLAGDPDPECTNSCMDHFWFLYDQTGGCIPCASHGFFICLQVEC